MIASTEVSFKGIQNMHHLSTSYLVKLIQLPSIHQVVRVHVDVRAEMATTLASVPVGYPSGGNLSRFSLVAAQLLTISWKVRTVSLSVAAATSLHFCFAPSTSVCIFGWSHAFQSLVALVAISGTHNRVNLSWCAFFCTLALVLFSYNNHASFYTSHPVAYKFTFAIVVALPSSINYKIPLLVPLSVFVSADRDLFWHLWEEV